jgi:hypothetical protein
MGLLFEDTKINDEFYRVRYGKKVSYEKCKVIDIEHQHKIVYIIKGRSKQKKQWIINRNIPAYNSKFFKTKEDLLLYINELIQEPSFYKPSECSPKILLEIQKFKKTKPQYFI